MNLTKEECENAYENLSVIRELLNVKSLLPCTYDRAMIIFARLIEERFNNTPLKFEELNERMWVWDNKTKSYIFVFKPLNWEPIKGLRYAHQIINHSAEGYYMDFEENRFYRKEVK